MKEIILSKGARVQVDDEDYEYLNQFKWTMLRTKSGRYARRGEGKYIRVLMHRDIMNTQKGMEVDHIDHNGLNNQRSNLRNCTRSENMRNSKSRGLLQYKGVCVTYRGARKLIIARIGKRHIGYFKTEESAALAYNKEAKIKYGEFAYINEL